MRRVAVGLVLVLALAGVAYAAETVHLYLKASGSNVNTVAPPPPLRFSISPVSALRTNLQSLRAVRIGRAATAAARPTVGPSATAAMSTPPPDPYATGSGVVVDMCHLRDTATGSFLSMGGVELTADFAAMLAAKDPGTWAYSVVDWNAQFSNRVGAARFQGLPTGQHTYLLTVGISAPVTNLTLGVWNAVESSTTVLSGSQLTGNPATSEVRALLSLNIPASSSPATRYMTVFLDILPKPAQTINGEYGVYTHHVQLARLD